MTSLAAFDRGLIAGILVTIGGQALYWLVTSAAQPHTGAAREMAVLLQAVVGFGGAGWLWYRARPRSTAS